jgi:diguanylate cyclase (GGDEF)-like protein
MENPLDADGLATAVIDALASQICVIDKNSTIIAVNLAWRRFGGENARNPFCSDIGSNYLRICQGATGPGGNEAADFANGVHAVLEGKADIYQLEYPCDSPSEKRWFLGRVTPIAAAAGRAVVSHLNISDRKRLELELVRLAATDSLTGLPNRRYFSEVGNREVERIHRFGGRAAAIMIDFDHFKAINDTYGHAAGDEVLRRLGRVLLDNSREVDLVGRLGGEEFAVVLPGADLEATACVAEKLRRIVSGEAVNTGLGTIFTTASFGVAEVWWDDRSIDDVLERADAALYNAKADGRNRVEVDRRVQSVRQVS